MEEYKGVLMEREISAEKTENRICYEGCSNVNPRLAETCDKLGDYYPRCPTYKAKLNGRMK